MNNIKKTGDGEYIPSPTKLISEEQVETDGGLKGDYFQQRLINIIRGNRVWVRRNFESDNGKVLDYFENGNHAGYVEVDPNGSCDVWSHNGVRLNDEPLTVELAVELLEFNR